MGPIVALFVFTIRQMLLSRKICLSLLVLSGPCALLLLVRNLAPASEEHIQSLWQKYHAVVQFLLFTGLIPLVCMIYGTALVGAEVENRTFTYLITRRMRRGTVLLVRFVATALVLAVLCDLALVGAHLCVFAGRDFDLLTATDPAWATWHPGHELGHYLLSIPVAVLGFLAVFTLIGLLVARPLAYSVLYYIIIELVLSNIPVRARVYSLLHHLRVTMVGAIPNLTRLFELPEDLREELYPPGATGLPGVFGVVVIALLASIVLVTVRELLPSKISRE